MISNQLSQSNVKIIGNNPANITIKINAYVIDADALANLTLEKNIIYLYSPVVKQISSTPSYEENISYGQGILNGGHFENQKIPALTNFDGKFISVPSKIFIEPHFSHLANSRTVLKSVEINKPNNHNMITDITQ